MNKLIQMVRESTQEQKDISDLDAKHAHWEAEMEADVDNIARMRAQLQLDEEDEDEKPRKPRDLCATMFEDMTDEFEAPDELIEGLLTRGAGSLLYGDSNSGKTFLAIDMACAVARGEPWMDRRVEKGLVIYVASESPASVRSRLQSYAKHHQCKIPNFLIIQAPVNLWSSDEDSNSLIAAIHAAEERTGQKAALIIGDTLARMSAGANENSGEDMGLVVGRFDRIRAETGAHFLLIHHSGKDSSKGARGHSSLRAAVDTELEVRDSATEGQFATVTKQRDLAGKGKRIGFSLKFFEMGKNKWGSSVMGGVVEPEECVEPLGKINVRVNTKEVAFMEYLKAGTGDGTDKKDAMDYAKTLLSRSKAFELVAGLKDSGKIREEGGKLYLAGVS
jgi:putative DNA primase/helicase